MILGATMAKKAHMSDSEMTGFMMFPLVMHTCAVECVLVPQNVFSCYGLKRNPR